MTGPATLDLRQQLLAREIALAILVLGIVSFPWLIDLTAASWAAIGGLLAFAVVSPRSLLLAVPAAIGISFKEFELGAQQYNVLEILVGIAFLGYVPRAFRACWNRWDDFRDRPRTLFAEAVPDSFAGGVAAALFIAGVISLFTVADPEHLRESVRTFRWVVLLPIAYFLSGSHLTRLHTYRELMAAMFVAGGAIAAALALLDPITGGGVGADAVTRLSGIAPHPNALALYLERVAVFALLVALLYRDRVNKLWLGTAAVITLVTVLTFSRGAVLGVVAGCLLLLLLVQSRRMAAYGAAVATVVFATLVAFAPERTLSLLGGGSGSLRIELWRSSLQMIRDHPLTGVGLDQFLYQYLPRYVAPEAWPERFTSHPHNLVLETWLSLGIIGAALLVLMAILWARRIRSAIAHRDRFALAAAGAIVAVAVHGMVDRGYFLPELAVSTWFLILLLRAPDSKDEPGSGPEREPKG